MLTYVFYEITWGRIHVKLTLNIFLKNKGKQIIKKSIKNTISFPLIRMNDLGFLQSKQTRAKDLILIFITRK